MKLTATQLKKIIAEEVKRATVSESISPVLFYTKKKQKLAVVLRSLDAAMEQLQVINEMELESDMGEEDTDVRSATNDLQDLKDFVNGILSATEAMVQMGRGGR